MATYGTQSVNTVGTAITYGAVTAADRFLPADHCFLHVKNANAGTCTVTLVTPGTVDGLAIADRTVAILTGAEAMIALPAALYRSSDGLGDVQFSPTSSVTAAVILV